MSTATPTAASAPPRQPKPRTRELVRMPWPMIVVFLAPALILYSVFVLYPIAQSMRYSLYDWNGLESLDNFVGLDNFRRAFSDEVFTDALQHNMILITLSVVLQIPFALGLAMLLNSKIKGRAVLRTLFFAPYVLSEVVTGVVWRQMLR
ncbi:MAG: sugar ABC transporter permease, partial [Actinomycetota bacterium]|nr:sugar ABC transporter permease [Actinomycetota bacterium]